MTSKPHAWFSLKPSRHQRSNGDCALRLATSVASKERSPWRTPIGLMDSRRYRNPVEPPHMLTPMGSRRDLSRSRGLTRSTVQRCNDANLFAARGDPTSPTERTNNHKTTGYVGSGGCRTILSVRFAAKTIGAPDAVSPPSSWILAPGSSYISALGTICPAYAIERRFTPFILFAIDRTWAKMRIRTSSLR